MRSGICLLCALLLAVAGPLSAAQAAYAAGQIYCCCAKKMVAVEDDCGMCRHEKSPSPVLDDSCGLDPHRLTPVSFAPAIFPNVSVSELIAIVPSPPDLQAIFTEAAREPEAPPPRTP